MVPEASSCPHCDRSTCSVGSTLGRVAKSCVKIATGGAVAVTLMACYGGPPHSYGPVPEPPEPCSAGAPPDQPPEPGCPEPNQPQQPLQPANTAQPPAPGFAEPPPGTPPGS